MLNNARHSERIRTEKTKIASTHKSNNSEESSFDVIQKVLHLLNLFRKPSQQTADSHSSTKHKPYCQCAFFGRLYAFASSSFCLAFFSFFLSSSNSSTSTSPRRSVTTPYPRVQAPSLIVKRRPFSKTYIFNQNVFYKVL